MDWDRFAAHDFMGSFSVPVQDVVNAPSGSLVQEFRLQGVNHGKVHLGLTWRPF